MTRSKTVHQGRRQRTVCVLSRSLSSTKHTRPRRALPLAFLLVFACVSIASGRPANDAWLAARYLAEHPPTYKGISRSSLYLTMHDGVKIAIDVNLPEGLKQGDKIPTILRQTRYFRSHDVGWLIRFLTRNWPSPQKLFVPRGYAWVDVDVRGTGASFGRWAYPWSSEEIRDGAEVVEWIVKQPWSNGRVGATGISYDGGAAEFLLVNQLPAVKATAPEFTLFDAYTDLMYPGGIYLSSFTRNWSNLNRALDADYVRGLVVSAPSVVRSSYHGVRPVDDDRDRSLLARAVREHAGNLDVNAAADQTTFRDDVPGRSGVPVDASSPFARAAEISASGATQYIVDGWFDAAFPNAAIKRYLTLRNPVRLIVGPWNHGGWNDASPFRGSLKSNFNIDAELLRFFDNQLRGIHNGITEEKPILYFTMGEEKWKSTTRWPPPGMRTSSFYLDEGGRLSTAQPSVADGSDKYVVDLTAGTGGSSRWDLGVPVIYLDRRAADEKLLCYTSAPLNADTEVTGNPVVTLYASSTATDGEFFAYLEDVDARGRVTYVTEGELRAIHRKLATDPPPYRQLGPYHSFKRKDAMLLVPGEVAALTFEILPTSYLFKRGHSIRLALAGADRDHFTVLQGSAPTVHFYRDGAHPSRIDLPMIQGVGVAGHAETCRRVDMSAISQAASMRRTAGNAAPLLENEHPHTSRSDICAIRRQAVP